MSRQEVVDAYIEGRISRRTLVRRLTAAGVGAAAALSYARLLEPELASARSAEATRTATIADDHYPAISVEILSKRLRAIRKRRKVKVAVATTGPTPGLLLEVYAKKGQNWVALGERDFGSTFATGTAQRNVAVEIRPRPLRRRKKARIRVVASSSNPNISRAQHTKRVS